MPGLQAIRAEHSPALVNEGELLSWCDQGLRALERAVKLDDAKNVLDLAATLNYAVRVRDMNQEAVIAASKLRIMAERRVGELIASERQAERLASNGGRRLRAVSVPDGNTDPVSLNDEQTELPTLADHGITHHEAAAYTKLAAVPAEQFEAVLDEVASDASKHRVAVTRAAVLRAIDPEEQRRSEEQIRDEAGRKFRLSLGQQIGILAILADLPGRITETVDAWGPNDPPLTLDDLTAARSTLDQMIEQWETR